jgi:monoamine oxidase
MADDNTVREEHCEIAVLGGGMAGLIAATELADRKVILLEADDRVGGRVRSVRHGDYWLNIGAQFAEGAGVFVDVLNRFEIPRGSLDDSRAALAWRGRVVASDNPAEFVLRSRLSLAGRVDLARLGLRLRRAYNRMANNPDRDDARQWREWLDARPASSLALEVRTSDVRTIFRGWVQHWVATEPDEIAAGHFAMYMGSALVKASELPNFSLPIGGNQVITDALGAALGDRVRLGAKVVSAARTAGGVEVTYHDRQGAAKVIAQRCVVAVPADQALAVVAEIDEPVREALQAVRYGQYVLAGLFTSEQGPQPWDKLYAIATPGLAFQVIYNHAAALRQAGPRKPGGALVAYAGGAPARALMEASDSQITDLYTRDLDIVFPGLRQLVDEVVVKRWTQSIPYWRPGERLGQRLLREPMGPFHFAGDYLGYPSMTTAATAGEIAARAARDALAP